MKQPKAFIGILVLSLMLTPMLSFAQSGQKGIHEPGTGIENPELRETGQEMGQGSQAQGQAKGKGVNQASDKATQRRSRVANAVQEMLRVAERNQGVGQQIRIIAQAQNQNQEQIEASMKQVKNRGRLKKFFFGPDYKNLNSIKNKLASHTKKLEQLKELAAQIANEADVEILKEQIEVMEQVKAELEKEAAEESKSFSLFGWLNKLL